MADGRPARFFLAAGRHFALAGGGLLVGFLAAEGLARLCLPPPERISLRAARKLTAAPDDDEDPPPAFTEEGTPNRLILLTPTGRRLRPNTVATIENHRLGGGRVVVATNELGFRHPPLGPKSGTRVLFLGDSITLSDHLNEPDTFVHGVGVLARAKGHEWETINGGVGSVGAETELQILTETGVRAAPDVVVLDYYLNDFEDSQGLRPRPPPHALAWSFFAAHLNYAVAYARAWFGGDPVAEKLHLGQQRAEFLKTHPAKRGNALKDREAFNELVARRFRDWGGAWSPATWERVRPALMAFGRLSRERGFRFYIVAFPVRLQVEADFYEDAPQCQLRAIAKELDVPLLDLLPPLRAASRATNEPLFFDHCHLTAEGSRRVASVIADFLSAREPSASAARRPGSGS